jgi:hypothetical protein
MIEIDEFYNQGFGWICKRCEQELRAETADDNEDMPRVWREGEAESKQMKLSAPIAKWLDAARTQLICPRCGISEIVNKA